MIVSCLSDGVQVRMVLRDAGFSGVLYVKGHSKEEECRKLISIPQNADSRMEIFKVMFGTCGLIHVNVSILKSYTFFFILVNIIITKFSIILCNRVKRVLF